MSGNGETADERSHLLDGSHRGSLVPFYGGEVDAESLLSSAPSIDEADLRDSAVGERRGYYDFSTVDWLHDLVKDSYRWRAVHRKSGIRNALYASADKSSGWIAVIFIGACMAVVAAFLDLAEATTSDWKTGYCRSNPFLDRESCCAKVSDSPCEQLFIPWTSGYWPTYGVYIAFSLLFGIVSRIVTRTTKRPLPVADSGYNSRYLGKSLFMAAGSGVPEVKSIISGFVMPEFLSLRVMMAKIVGTVFAIGAGLCLAKEDTYMHLSTCIGHSIASWLPKYKNNERNMRKILFAACSAGMSAGFGVPIGGVLFTYEHASAYFSRPVLWMAFLCSMTVSVVLKALNPGETGQLVLRTNYDASYQPVHYLIFMILGVAGGLFGGLFCPVNAAWLRWMKGSPIYSLVIVSAILQFQNPIIRQPGNAMIKTLLLDCRDPSHASNWICQRETQLDGKWGYVGWLSYSYVVRFALSIMTFGSPVPSGIIMPALGVGAFFGRIVGQFVTSIPPGIFAVVGAGASLAGVSRMTLSLIVIMFELTGDYGHVIPHMMAIIIAKWVANIISTDGVYDVNKALLGHPFLDTDRSLKLVKRHKLLAWKLIPPDAAMGLFVVPAGNKVVKHLLETRLASLSRQGLDAGLLLVKDGLLQGYLAQEELQFGLRHLLRDADRRAEVRLLGGSDGEELDLSHFVDRTTLTLSSQAPMEYAVEMFGKLGLRYLCIVEEGTGKPLGLVTKKRIVSVLSGLTE
ncbi:Clc chloride channel [Trichodelitschia bisporula]|uniref:Chloride channel protein n=1 Tax=Trichodelitschia bisporula TaxID=703511 RepID=A0A6G1I010_9PEZI|nr:Clc chloride channel [Trichodelitschia bisporula]